MRLGIGKLPIILLVSLLTLGLQWARAEDPALVVKLTFSTDGGQTYSAQPRITGKPTILKVRATFEHNRPDGEKEPYMAVMFCKEADFASASSGKQSWVGGPAWYQRPVPEFIVADQPLVFDFDLDLRARPEGVLGKANRWDPVLQKQVDAPLPACPSLSSGRHTFVVRVYYPLRKVKPVRQIDGRAQFTLNFGSAAAAAPK